MASRPLFSPAFATHPRRGQPIAQLHLWSQITRLSSTMLDVIPLVDFESQDALLPGAAAILKLRTLILKHHKTPVVAKASALATLPRPRPRSLAVIFSRAQALAPAHPHTPCRHPHPMVSPGSQGAQVFRHLPPVHLYRPDKSPVRLPPPARL